MVVPLLSLCQPAVKSDYSCSVPKLRIDTDSNSFTTIEYTSNVADADHSGKVYLHTDVPIDQLKGKLKINLNTDRYKLVLSGNRITTLKNRLFFNQTVYLDISNSYLTNITDDALQALIKLKEIYLHDNLLTHLPAVVTTLNFSFEKLSLYGNKFDSSCNQAWMKPWLLSLGERLDHPDAMQCYSSEWMRNKNILGDSTNFCAPAPSAISFELLPILITLAGILLLLILTGAILFGLRVKVYSSFGVHLFDRDECEGAEMEYDVFIAFAHEDRVVAREILFFLESTPNFCKVCFHERDFMAGELILGNILSTVYRSKRVLCLLSQNFLNSDYCLEEFEIASRRHIQLKRSRMIVMLLDGFELHENPVFTASHNRLIDVRLVSDDQIIPLLDCTASLRDFVSRRTYIAKDSDNWKQQLIYAVPVNRLRNNTAVENVTT